MRATLSQHLGTNHWPGQSRQQCYKRVTISCHLSYLTLDSNSQDGADTKESLDREAVFPFRHKAQDHNDDSPNIPQSLFRASSSVLLTLAEPVESKSHEEETSLLHNPEALWTVIVLNSPTNLGYDHEPAQYLTPIAQYVRGMASSVVTQRNNAQGIYDAIKGHIADNEGEGMFDDKNFTKSVLYHWAVQACDELAESISSSLRFLRKTLETNVKKLCTEAHVYERLGIVYWMQRMDEELFALEDLESQIIALRGRVQENVSTAAVYITYEILTLLILTCYLSATRYVFSSLVFADFGRTLMLYRDCSRTLIVRICLVVHWILLVVYLQLLMSVAGISLPGKRVSSCVRFAGTPNGLRGPP